MLYLEVMLEEEAELQARAPRTQQLQQVVPEMSTRHSSVLFYLEVMLEEEAELQA